MTERTPGSAGSIATPLLVAAGMGCGIGLLEWLRAPGSADDFAAVARSLLVVAPLYALFGLFVGGLVFLAPRPQRPAFAVGLPVGLLVAISVVGEDVRPIEWIAGLCVTAGIGFVIAKGIGRIPAIVQPFLFWSGCALLLSLAILLALPPSYEGRFAIALTAAIIPAASAVGAVLMRQLGAWLAIAGMVASLALLSLVIHTLPEPTPRAAAKPESPNILLITMDTTRADRVGAYGYEAARTPNVDAVAKRGTLFREVVTPTVFTGPSHASILTGIHPKRHGFQINAQGMRGDFATIADDLRGAGYVTAAFPSAWTTIGGGLPESFDHADTELREYWFLPQRAYNLVLLRPVQPRLYRMTTWTSYRPAQYTVDRALDWLSARPASSPFFAWVHFFDPHLPYSPPADLLDPKLGGTANGHWYGLDAHERERVIRSETEMTRMRALYDAEIAYVDRELGRLFGAARKATGDNLWIVVTADHGEPMGEHGRYWARDLYDQTLRVPLVVAPPKGAPGLVSEVRQQVRLIDLAPTLLELAGVPSSLERDGQSLVGLMTGASDEAPPHALSILVHEDTAYDRSSASVRTNAYKLIERQAGFKTIDVWQPGGFELYDLSQDPNETVDLSDRQPEVRAQLQPLLQQGGEEALSNKRKHQLGKDEAEQLKALGYMH